MPLDEEIIGRGVYTPREAARLIGTSSQQVLRWTRGSGPSSALLPAHYRFLDEDVTEISFLDLIEVRVINAMRKAGIPLQSIRFAIAFAQDKYGMDRPLASASFKTDGTEILMEAIESDGNFVSLSRKRPGQKVFREIIISSLNDLEYENETVARWRPKKFSEIIIDPKRFFGDPILDQFGVSTRTLQREFDQFGSTKYLSQIYEIPERLVVAGINFELSLDKANG